MSHVVALECVIHDDQIHLIKRACEKLGLVFHEGKTSFRWFGQWVNDYNQEDAAYQRGINTADYGKCEHAIGMPDGKGYEVGVCRDADGKLRFVFDFFGQKHHLQKVVGDRGEKLRVAFEEERVVYEAQEAGFEVISSQVNAQGTREIRIRPKGSTPGEGRATRTMY